MTASSAAQRGHPRRQDQLEDCLQGGLALLNELDAERMHAWLDHVSRQRDLQDDDDGDDEDASHRDGDGEGTEKHSTVLSAEDEPAYSWTQAKVAPANRHSNRYNNIASWDHALLPGPYLNAALIPPLPLPLPPPTDKSSPSASEENAARQAYVASQAPTPRTFATFYSHLYAQRVRVLVMLTPLRERGQIKADAYWPSALADSEAGASNASASAGSSQMRLDEGGVGPRSFATRLQRLYGGGQGRGHAEGQQSQAASTSSRDPSSGPSQNALLLGSSGWAVDLLDEQELHTCPPVAMPSGSSSSSNSSPKPLPEGTHLTLRHLRIYAGTEPPPPPSSAGPAPPPAGGPEQARRPNTHDVLQLHLASWPDFGADSTHTLDSLLDWIDHLQSRPADADADAIHPSSAGAISPQGARDEGRRPPIWIHCSAGVGRSGTVIAAHMLRHDDHLGARRRSRSVSMEDGHELALDLLRGSGGSGGRGAEDGQGEREREEVAQRILHDFAHLWTAAGLEQGIDANADAHAAADGADQDEDQVESHQPYTWQDAALSLSLVAYLRRFRPAMVQVPAQLAMVCHAAAAARRRGPGR